MAQVQVPIRAPELPDGMLWLNTKHPIRLADLRGKVVLLDFWTYCCINCMHIIPDLRYLEHKYKDELVVIGVHSAKFVNERESANIREAILRYNIEHPVVNDHEFRIWQEYTVRAWPTLIVVKPDGYVFSSMSGEVNCKVLVEMIDELTMEARSHGKLNLTPMNFALERDNVVPKTLSFPGKVYAHEPSHRLFISDSNNNRIVIATLDGKVLDVAGDGRVGQGDGDFATARFNHPQGMSLDGDTLYIADTENHLIRKLDLVTRMVETIAGTGEQARQHNLPGHGRHVALNSPWDLQLIGLQLFIAMAGSHQIWVMNRETDRLEPYAGSSREDLVDGPRLQAAMAQPSGITSDGTRLFVADSETSAIRVTNIEGAGAVYTIVGEGLFEFGDCDGTELEQVRLQHPMGIDYYNGMLYVADTYNHKIKCISPGTVTSVTYLGSGEPGASDGQAPAFYEPGGLSVAAGKLYIADTNNHTIRIADLASEAVHTLRLKDLVIPAAVTGFSTTRFIPNERIEMPLQSVAAGTVAQLSLYLKFPNGYHLNPRAPFTYAIDVKGHGIVVAEVDREQSILAPCLPLAIPFRADLGEHRSDVTIDATFYYCCDDNTGECAIQSVRWTLPLQTTDQVVRGGPSVSYQVILPNIAIDCNVSTQP